MQQNTHSYGFSITELLITLCILGFLFFVALPNLSLFLMRQERELSLQRLRISLSFAQNAAFKTGKTISLCASRDKKTCDRELDWSTGYIIFENEKEEKQPSNLAKILEATASLQFGRLSYSGQGELINIQSNGMTMNMGAFQYSPKYHHDERENAKLIFNRACRCRIDSNR